MADIPPSLILNVNDDMAARYVITRMLQMSGFTVIEAETGAEALQIAAAKSPSLIVLDVNLPDISGIEVCRQIKSAPATTAIPVLHVSAARIRNEDKAYGLESGADGYLTQPVDAAVLTATVNALLRLSRAEARAREAARAWEAVFGAISDSVCLINSDGCVQRCNRAMAALVGKPVEEVEGHQYADILIETYPGTAFPPEMTTPVERQAIIEIPIASSERQHWLRLTAEPMIAGLTGDAAADGSSIRILADITDSKEAALRQRSFLRDILASVTEGKLHLCLGAEDLPEPLPQQDKKVQLSQKSLHYLREDVRKIANTLGFPQDRQQDLETAVGEAGMNAVVHAGHGIGHVHANETGTIQVWIEDSGRGIAIERIHRATLERGYTTAGTLGHGFWIILKTCDRVYLLTSEAGTTVVLEQDRVAPSPAWAKPPMI